MEGLDVLECCCLTAVFYDNMSFLLGYSCFFLLYTLKKHVSISLIFQRSLCFFFIIALMHLDIVKAYWYCLKEGVFNYNLPKIKTEEPH